jgi:hypothetical protein
MGQCGERVPRERFVSSDVRVNREARDDQPERGAADQAERLDANGRVTCSSTGGACSTRRWRR